MGFLVFLVYIWFCFVLLVRRLLAIIMASSSLFVSCTWLNVLIRVSLMPCLTTVSCCVVTSDLYFVDIMICSLDVI